MNSVLITGANGQLGMALRAGSECFEGFKLYFTDIDTLDILDKPAVESYIKSSGIDTVVNCAAYTAVDKAEDDAERCIRINCDAVRNIGEVAASLGVRVIHVSTDYVFDGKGARPYREEDATNPVSVYGKSKLAGEQALTAACPDAVIIRTAWLYSETGANFMKTMLRLGMERDRVGVVADQQGTPTYAGDLADAILKVLASGAFVPGIYHYTDEGVCTWYDFAVRIFEIAGLKCSVDPLATAGYPTRAVRPAYSVLDKTKIRDTYGVITPPWEESLRKCLQHHIMIKQQENVFI
ncbi:MAG: dTDP-4-dehydrorhamnose reductase [Tannerella sp.]|jgi:dTDP-4-dehydrorhamnose reductase|nr:dTDP-4-dehydrorhamnose reductase [Tannerella sp.]